MFTDGTMLMTAYQRWCGDYFVSHQRCPYTYQKAQVIGGLYETYRDKAEAIARHDELLAELTMGSGR